MNTRIIGARAVVSTLAMVLSSAAYAQSLPSREGASGASTPEQEEAGEILVTGSRIRRLSTDSSAPVVVLNKQQFEDRGFVTAGQALNSLTSIAPANPQTDGRAQTVRDGATYPNLFGLGNGRTLTLLDGRRMVTTSSGLGDRVVDTNIIPVGLIERIDVVQAGGAAVYGSDAVAGVVNYVLKKNFSGVELDLQSGVSSRGDYPERSLRLTAGRNFAEGRGNIAIDLGWSKSQPLSTRSRPTTNPYQLAAPNPADTGPADGIPAIIRLTDARFYSYNKNGVIFTVPAPVALPPCGNQICFLRNAGVPQQFAQDGQSITSFNPGTVYSPPFANGGQGESFGDIASLYVGNERFTANAVAHFDITDRLTISASGLYAKVRSTDPIGAGQAGALKTVLTASTGNPAIPFTRNNPYLNTATLNALRTLSPSFAAGAPLFLSKNFADLLTTNTSVVETETYRGLVSIDGNFDVGGRRIDYSVSYSHAEVNGESNYHGLITSRFNNAIATTRNGAGQIVCAINAVTVTDAQCAPINPFGNGNVSQAARDYVSGNAGTAYHNKQDDLLATISGDVVNLPAGTAKFSLGYEHRNESSRFDPALDVQQGLITGVAPTRPTKGSYNTDEFSAEILIPVVGGDFTLPLVHRLELAGQYRHVDNSIAGKEGVWGLNAQWDVVPGVTLRGSRSRNFRAPTLDQLFAPTLTQPGGILIDPCDTRFINSGPNPAVRRQNCVALFSANPGFNGGRGLNGFVDANANTAGALITARGNLNLQNEISNTLTFGLVLQPRFVPGLVITADRIRVNIDSGLINYLPQNFTQACFDSSPSDPAFCNTFTRNANGDIITALNTTVNAASIKYRGETYRADYNFDIGGVFGGADIGTFGIGLEATHNKRLSTVAAGVQTEQADTTFMPDWVTRLDLRWQRGPIRLTYQGIFLPKSRVNVFDTIETTPNPTIASNFRHSVSVVYDLEHIQFRLGVINLTDKLPSYPTTNYGDILGRRFFAGARVKF